MNNLDHTIQILESVERIARSFKEDGDFNLDFILNNFKDLGKIAEGFSELKDWWETLSEKQKKFYLSKIASENVSEDDVETMITTFMEKK